MSDDPKDRKFLAALAKYRKHGDRNAYRLVQEALSAAKADPEEWARLVKLTRQN